MSTSTCKNFLQTIAKQYYLNPKSTWKRISKKTYAQTKIEARRFKNEDGDEVTINEFADGSLFVTDLEYNNSDTFPSELTATLGYGKLVNELIQLGLKALPDLDDEDVALTAFEEVWSEAEINNFINNPTMVSDNIEQIINTLDLSYAGNQLYYGLIESDKDNFFRDLKHNNIQYDYENFETTIKKTNNMAYVEMVVGGDWETPVISYAYWSEKENRIKGFLPKGIGNTYNMETATAYGSEMERIYETDPDNDIEDYERDAKVGFEDYADWQKAYEKASIEGLKQLQKHIIREYQYK